MKTQEPTLLFFRSHPDNLKEKVSIASSMQALETSFFLIALERYPHALSVCASAIESCLQAASIGSKEKDGFQDLVKKARKFSEKIDNFRDDLLVQFRETRNKIIHHGFSPQDDSESTSLYLEVGLPFLSLCYQEFHKFNLMDGLVTEYADHINLAQKVHQLAKQKPNIDMSYCLRGFGHLVRWSFKPSFSTNWEVDALIHAEEIGDKFERMYKEKQKLEQLFKLSWSFNCPICHDFDSVVAEIDSAALDVKDVKLVRMVCTNCGLMVFNSQPYLSQFLLEKQIIEAKEKILAEYY